MTDGRETLRWMRVARIAVDLRALLTPEGVVAWLAKGHPRLDGRTPLEVVMADDEDGLRVVREIVASALAGSAA